VDSWSNEESIAVAVEARAHTKRKYFEEGPGYGEDLTVGESWKRIP
jgi:hypothetical protein